VAAAAADAIGTVAARLSSTKRRTVERHLRRALGPELRGRELRRTVDEVYRSYARY
jgi:lauroyl/myristoyl acyltransferase